MKVLEGGFAFIASNLLIRHTEVWNPLEKIEKCIVLGEFMGSTVEVDTMIVKEDGAEGVHHRNEVMIVLDSGGEDFFYLAREISFR